MSAAHSPPNDRKRVCGRPDPVQQAWWQPFMQQVTIMTPSGQFAEYYQKVLQQCHEYEVQSMSFVAQNQQPVPISFSSPASAHSVIDLEATPETEQHNVCVTPEPCDEHVAETEPPKRPTLLNRKISMLQNMRDTSFDAGITWRMVRDKANSMLMQPVERLSDFIKAYVMSIENEINSVISTGPDSISPSYAKDDNEECIAFFRQSCESVFSQLSSTFQRRRLSSTRYSEFEEIFLTSMCNEKSHDASDVLNEFGRHPLQASSVNLKLISTNMLQQIMRVQRESSAEIEAWLSKLCDTFKTISTKLVGPKDTTLRNTLEWRTALPAEARQSPLRKELSSLRTAFIDHVTMHNHKTAKLTKIGDAEARKFAKKKFEEFDVQFTIFHIIQQMAQALLTNSWTPPTGSSLNKRKRSQQDNEQILAYLSQAASGNVVPVSPQPKSTLPSRTSSVVNNDHSSRTTQEFCYEPAPMYQPLHHEANHISLPASHSSSAPRTGSTSRNPDSLGSQYNSRTDSSKMSISRDR